MIGVIDYRAGNLASVSNALKRLSVPHLLSNQKKELEQCEKVIFPGVGHAAAAMSALQHVQLVQWLKNTTKPVLGICLGMQLLFKESPEGGNTTMLGILPEQLSEFDDSLVKVPHMGWNSIRVERAHALLQGIEDGTHFYFVHSYYAPLSNCSLASCEYQEPFSAVVAHKNFLGVQFHPEKSGSAGELLLKNFASL